MLKIETQEIVQRDGTVVQEWTAGWTRTWKNQKLARRHGCTSPCSCFSPSPRGAIRDFHLYIISSSVLSDARTKAHSWWRHFGQIWYLITKRFQLSTQLDNIWKWNSTRWNINHDVKDVFEKSNDLYKKAILDGTSIPRQLPSNAFGYLQSAPRAMFNDVRSRFVCNWELLRVLAKPHLWLHCLP